MIVLFGVEVLCISTALSFVLASLLPISMRCFNEEEAVYFWTEELIAFILGEAITILRLRATLLIFEFVVFIDGL